MSVLTGPVWEVHFNFVLEGVQGGTPQGGYYFDQGANDPKQAIGAANLGPILSEQTALVLATTELGIMTALNADVTIPAGYKILLGRHNVIYPGWQVLN